MTPEAITFEEFRRRARERLGCCIECGKLVEGINAQRYGEYPDGIVVDCDCGGMVLGAIVAWERKLWLVPQPPVERQEREQKLLEMSVAGFEGADDMHYVWVDGVFEPVELMTDERLSTLTRRAFGLSSEERERLLHFVMRREKR